MIKKILIALAISIFVFTATVLIYYYGAFEKPDLFAFDVKSKIFRSDKIPPSVIKVVLVDDASIKALERVAGRWPWPRKIWADLLDFMKIGGAKAVLFDILFDARQDKESDGVLATATQSSGNIYHSMMINRARADDDRRSHAELGMPLPKDFVARYAINQIAGGLPIKSEEKNNDFTLPIGPLRSVSQGIAVVEFPTDSDGVLRRTKPLREYQGKYFPVLGLAPFIDEHSRVIISKDAITINDRVIPVDNSGNYAINMYGVDMVKPYSISGIFSSLQKIQQGDVENLLVNPDEFKDAIVFIGVSAVGGSDLKPTPLAASSPGVIFHVSLAANYLMNDFLKPPDQRLTVASMILGAFLTTLVIFFSNRFFIRVAFPLALLSAYVGYALFAFKSNRMVEEVPFIFSTVTSSFLSFGYLAFTEAAEKRKVSHLFTQYVSKDVLHEVLHNYKEYQKASAGTKVELTVLFSDIRGFTTMSETTPPEKIVEMLNVHFTVMADIILRHKGTIDKYIGDAIMAFWGAPVKMADHPEQAVLAAREMLAALEQVNATLKERGFEHEIKIGVGINTGVATIGEIGSEQKKNYTVVGDTVNLASRLESITKEYKTPLIFSEYTYEKIKDKINCRPLGSVKVKGREQPVTIYTAE